MNEELTDVAVPALADAEELLLAPREVFPRDKAQPCGQISGLLELASVAHGGKKGGGAQCSDSGYRHEPAGYIFSIGNRSYLLVTSCMRCSNSRRSANRSVSSLRIAGERSFDASSNTSGRTSLNGPLPDSTRCHTPGRTLASGC